MKKLVVMLVSMMLVGMTGLAVADTEDTATLEVTMDPEGTAEITITPTTHTFSGAIGDVISTSGGYFTLNNTGDVNITLQIEGEDCGSGEDDWTIAEGAGYNQFAIAFKYADDQAGWTQFVDAKESLVDDNSVNWLPTATQGTNTRDIDFRCGLPTSASSTGNQQFTITITATPENA